MCIRDSFKGKRLFLVWFLALFGIFVQYFTMATYGYTDVLIDNRLVSEKLAVFPYARYILNSVSNSLSYDIVRFKIEVGVEEKFMCKNVIKQTQHVHCDSSDNDALRGSHMHDLDLTVNMLGLCDPSNLLFVLSAEERRARLKLF